MKGRQRGRAPGPRGVAGVCTLTPGPDSLWTEIGVSVHSSSSAGTALHGPGARFSVL